MVKDYLLSGASFLLESVRNYLFIFLVLTVTFTALKSSSTEYYVDYDSGFDSNNGLTTNTPFKHCPGDVAQNQNAEGVNLVGGDIVHFKKGVVYKLEIPSGILIQFSGTRTNPITYEGGTWGTSTNNAQISAMYDENGVQRSGMFSAFQNQAGYPFSGITIKSFQIGPLGGALVLPIDNGIPASSVAGYGILAYNTSLQNVVISNCSFNGIGYWFNQKPMSFDGASFAGTAIQCDGFNNLTIINCQFKNCSYAIEAPLKNTSVGLDIGWCDFSTNIIWCVDLDIWNRATFDNINVHDCLFHGYDKYIGSQWNGYGQCPHCDGIFYRGNPAYTWNVGTNINFYNNYFYDGGNATASIYLTDIASCNIFNNVFYYASCANGNIAFAEAASVGFTVRIYNNTFIGDGVIDIFFRGPWATNNILVDVKNNLFYDTAVNNNSSFLIYETGFNSDEIQNTPQTIHFDNNCYSSVDPYGYFFLGGFLTPLNLDGSGGHVMGGVRDVVGWETNGFAMTPKFKSIDTADFSLSTNSMATSGGANLTSTGILQLLKDINGVNRPTNSGWSVGAYQYINTNSIKIILTITL